MKAVDGARAAPLEHLEMPLAPSLAKLERFPLALHGILRGAYRTSLRFPAMPCVPAASLASLAHPPDYKERPMQPVHFTESDRYYRGHCPTDGHTESHLAPNKPPFLLPPKLQRNRQTPVPQIYLGHTNQSLPKPSSPCRAFCQPRVKVQARSHVPQLSLGKAARGTQARLT